MRLIYADILKAHVKMQTDLLRKFSSISELGELATVMADAFEREVDIQPTVDAVPVIRCKDCKAFNGLKCVRNNMIAVRTDDYCSRAERNEE